MDWEETNGADRNTGPEWTNHFFFYTYYRG